MQFIYFLLGKSSYFSSSILSMCKKRAEYYLYAVDESVKIILSYEKKKKTLCELKEVKINVKQNESF